jgi:hypothetical protein
VRHDPLQVLCVLRVLCGEIPPTRQHPNRNRLRKKSVARIVCP